MRRREFITLLSGVAVGRPLGADAQQGDRIRRLGILMAGAESDPHYQADVAVFREGLQKLGWVDGQNIRIEVRWAGFDAETMRRYAKELIALQPDLILSHDTPTTTTLLQHASAADRAAAAHRRINGSSILTASGHPTAAPPNSRRLVCRESSILRGDGGRFTTPLPSRLEARSRLGF
jgi:putative tryptophan/tyrosine transport system substrate-binding protein